MPKAESNRQHDPSLHHLESEQDGVGEIAPPSAPDDLSLRARGSDSSTRHLRTKPAGVVRQRRPTPPDPPMPLRMP